MTRAEEDTIPRVRRDARAVAVVGALGGCGASTFAALLAKASRTYFDRVVLVDADFQGPGIELALGMEQTPGLRWDDLADSTGSIDPVHLVAALPCWQKIPVLGPRAVFDFSECRAATHRTAWEQTQSGPDAALAALRSGQDLVVIDLPRQSLHTSPGSLADTLVVLTGQDSRSIATTARLVAWAHSRELAIHGVVVTAQSKTIAFADVTALLGHPAIRMRPERDLHLWLEKGFGPPDSPRRPMNRAATQLATKLAGISEHRLSI